MTTSLDTATVFVTWSSTCSPKNKVATCCFLWFLVHSHVPGCCYICPRINLLYTKRPSENKNLFDNFTSSQHWFLFLPNPWNVTQWMVFSSLHLIHLIHILWKMCFLFLNDYEVWKYLKDGLTNSSSVCEELDLK